MQVVALIPLFLNNPWEEALSIMFNLISIRVRKYQLQRISLPLLTDFLVTQRQARSVLIAP
jgi:hypothetical protein